MRSRRLVRTWQFRKLIQRVNLFLLILESSEYDLERLASHLAHIPVQDTRLQIGALRRFDQAKETHVVFRIEGNIGG